jgi:VWFA-related protein
VPLGRVPSTRRPDARAMFVLAAAMAGFVSAQTPQFRGRVDIVRTDVTVIDNRTGKPVTGLTGKDFTVSENGVRQTIASFIAEEGEALGGAQGPGLSSETGGHQRITRSFLFVLGAGQISTSDPLGHLARFLRDQLRPTDRASLMVWNFVTPFTDDFSLLSRIVNRLRTRPMSIAAVFARREAFAPGSPGEAAALDWLLAPDEPRTFLRPAALAALGTPEVGAVRRLDRLHDHLVGNVLLKTAAGIEFLRHQPGEKRLVVISAYGISPPFDIKFYPMVRSNEEAVALGQRAANAGIALELINTIGTERGLAYANAIQTMQATASESGGEFASVRTVGQQLSRIDDGSRHGYIIGYAPTNPSLDSTRRSLKIEVNRKDVTVIYRRAYTAQPELPPLNLQEHVTRVRLEEASWAPIDFTDIQVRGSTRSETGADGPHVRFELRVDPTRITWTERDGVREATLDVLALVGDRRRETIGSLSQRWNVTLTSAQWSDAIKAGIPYAVVVPVKGRPLNAKVLIYSFDTDRIGSLSLTVR